MVNDEIALNLLYSQVFEIENYSVLFSFPSYDVEESENVTGSSPCLQHSDFSELPLVTNEHISSSCCREEERSKVMIKICSLYKVSL